MKNESLKGRKILIVEDDASSCLYLNTILKKTGAELLNAVNGQEAIDTVLGDNEIELVLMDIRLPVMDGYKSAEMIRKIKPDIAIIAQTAYSFAGAREKFIRSGFNDFIIKPINPGVLLEKIRACLEKVS